MAKGSIKPPSPRMYHQCLFPKCSLRSPSKNTNVFLVSAELAAVCSKLGRIPTVAEYMEAVGVLNKDSENIY